MGEGWGEGEYSAILCIYVPLPFIPSHQGRGNWTFYELINTKLAKKLRIQRRMNLNYGCTKKEKVKVQT